MTCPLGPVCPAVGDHRFGPRQILGGVDVEKRPQLGIPGAQHLFFDEFRPAGAKRPLNLQLPFVKMLPGRFQAALRIDGAQGFKPGGAVGHHNVGFVIHLFDEHFHQPFFQKRRVAGAKKTKLALHVKKSGMDSCQRASQGKKVGDEGQIPLEKLQRIVGHQDDFIKQLRKNLRAPICSRALLRPLKRVLSPPESMTPVQGNVISKSVCDPGWTKRNCRKNEYLT